MKENRHAAKCSVLMERQKDFPSKNVLIRNLKKLNGYGGCQTKHGYKTERLFASGFLSSITRHLICVKNSINVVGTLCFVAERRALDSRSY